MPSGPTKQAGKTIRPAKAITADVMDVFLPKLTKAITSSQGNLTIDCSRINQLDAIGAAVLLQARNTCRAAGGKLVLAHLKNNIENIFRVLGLDSTFDL